MDDQALQETLSPPLQFPVSGDVVPASQTEPGTPESTQSQSSCVDIVRRYLAARGLRREALENTSVSPGLHFKSFFCEVGAFRAVVCSERLLPARFTCAFVV